MGDFDPVSWQTIESVFGPPAAEVHEYVDRLNGKVSDEEPFTAVKTIYDAWKTDLGADRTLNDQAAADLITYLLERDGSIALGKQAEARSLTERRPSADRLWILFWEQEHTLWWIGVRTGVHWAVVRYWLWEDEIPLMERNFAEDSLKRIRTHREAQTG